MLFVKLKPWLYQGNYKDSTDVSALHLHGVGAILQFAVNAQHASIETLYLPFHDGSPIPPEYIGQGLDFVLAQHEQNKTVLVGCMAGISRSTTFSAGVLKATEGMSLRDALYYIRQRHPFAQPHPKVWRSMCKYYGEPFNRSDLGL